MAGPHRASGFFLRRGNAWEYDPNDIDLLRVKQKNPESPTGYDLLASYTYQPTDPPHLPATVTDASGQTTTYTYRSNGDTETVVTPERDNLSLAERTTTFDYYPDDAPVGPGRLQRVTRPLPGATTSYTYDDFGRVRTVTNSDGYTATIDYDVMNRPTRTSYPDGTFEEMVYNRLDAEHRRDRLGRWSHTFHDALRRVSVTQDSLGRTITQVWCSCGSLDKLIDGNGNETSWERDIQGRVKKEVKANRSETVYIYENTIDRLKRVTDPKGQHEDYDYNRDNSLRQVSYFNAERPTPTVAFTYDPSYDRLTKMSDGTGDTTYSYFSVTTPPTLGAGQLMSVDGPLPNDTITYTYDELGRVRMRAINDVQLNQVYDPLGRVRGETNPLGSFTYTYEGATSRLQSVVYPNGQTTTYRYYPNEGNHRLQEIHNQLADSSTLSKFNYAYDSVGNIKVWTQQVRDDTARTYGLSYDAADQLTAATLTATDAIPVTLKRYVYTYDGAGNRSTEQVDDGVMVAGYDNMNRLKSQQPGGALRFKGTLNEAATVTVQARPAQVSSDNKFEGPAQVTSGLNTVEIKAKDYTGNERTNTYEVNVSGGSKTFAYDPNGNLTGDGTRTFEWDARNRLIAVNQGTLRSEFSYDGWGHRVRIVEKNDGAVMRDLRFLWCGMTICEERDASGGTVTRRLYDQGFEEGGAAFYYTSDHLGSIRELTDRAGVVRVRYEYDPYGRVTKVSGDKDSPFTFTGHYNHAPSSLMLAPLRAYDPELARWISPDPIGIGGGLNLYGYVAGDPINLADPLGLAGQATATKTAEKVVTKGFEYVTKPPKPPVPWGTVGLYCLAILAAFCQQGDGHGPTDPQGSKDTRTNKPAEPQRKPDSKSAPTKCGQKKPPPTMFDDCQWTGETWIELDDEGNFWKICIYQCPDGSKTQSAYGDLFRDCDDTVPPMSFPREPRKPRPTYH